MNDLGSNPISLESKDLDPTDNEGVRDALMEAFGPVQQPGEAAKIATEINPINHPPVERLVRSTKVSPLSRRARTSRRWCALSFGGRPQLKLGRRRETPSATGKFAGCYFVDVVAKRLSELADKEHTGA